MDTYVPTSFVAPTADSRYIFYEFLHFIPVEEKNEYWAAQCLLFNKFNSERMVPMTKYMAYKKLDRGIIDVNAYKNIIDPRQPDGSGGKASYFASSWEPNPINIHLRNILEANLDKLPISLNVKAADEYFQLAQQKENSRIMGRKQFLNLLNEMNAYMDLPQLRADEDPFKYVRNMAAAIEPKEGESADAQNSASQDAAVTMMDNIKNLIEDNEDLALYNEYIYKDGVEVALELGMSYYMDLNKWEVNSDRIKSDIINFNCAACRFYTSETNGRPQLEPMSLDSLWTNAFFKPDGSDILYWWREYDITFGEFVRQFGAGLTRDQLKEIFDLNRTLRGNWNSGPNVGPVYDGCSVMERENAMVRVGYMEWMTQNMDVYSEGVIRDNFRYKKMPSDWQPKKGSPYQRQERYLNMWYKCYYVPAFVSSSPQTWQTSDFVYQSKFIFNFGPLQDQMREGDDQRYGRSSLVCWRSFKASWTDIEQKFMPKINLLWMQYENDIANAMPHGMWFSEELLTQLMNVVDEAQNDGKDSNLETIRKLKQSGYGVGKLFDEQGRRIPPFVEIKTGHLASAKERLISIMDLYTIMVQSLGLNELTEGAAPKPRQNMGSIQQANQLSSNATYFIEKGFTDIYKELGFRLMSYFKDVVAAGPSERLKEFRDVVGRATAWALESIANIPYRKLGVLVDAINTAAQNTFLNNLALQMSTAPNPLLSPDEAIELTFIENVKYKFALLRLKMKRKRKENIELQLQQQQAAAQAAQQQFQAQMQLKQMDNQGKQAEIAEQGQYDIRLAQVEAQLKHLSQKEIKNIIKDNRIAEDAAAAEIEVNKEQRQALA